MYRRCYSMKMLKFIKAKSESYNIGDVYFYE